MKKSTKKGFTIVELVVVIAIIAILAAVLIPTFSNLVKKAKLSNDQSMIRNINTTLMAEVIPATKFDYAGDAISALYANGWNMGKLQAYSTGYRYAYHLETNKMYLVNDSNQVVYPDSTVSLSDLWILWSNNAIDKVAGTTKYIALVNITNSGYYSTHFNDGATYTLDLAGHYMGYTGTTLTNVTVINGVMIAGATTGSNIIQLEEGKKENISAGTTETRTIIENRVFSYTTELRNTVESTANVTYKNCYFYNWIGSGVGVMKVNATFDGCTFIDTPSGSYVFNLQGDSNDAYEGAFTLKDCTFINCARGINIPVFVLGEDNPGSITITGNTFYGVTQNDRSAIQLCYQKNSGATEASTKGYITITIENNTFAEIASTQAGLITLHETLIKISDVSADKIAFSNNTVSSDIDSSKYIVNDDGKADSAFSPYNITDFKNALTTKFNAGKK